MITRIRIVPTIIIFLLVSVQVAAADTRFGLGAGMLYNGLGINASKPTDRGLAFLSLGCMGFSVGLNSDSEDDGTDTETNCGIGAGFFSTSLLSSKKHTLGISGGLTYDTDLDGFEATVTPGYVFFFNGIESRGFNLGLGGLLEFGDSRFQSPEIALNIGYHF